MKNPLAAKNVSILLFLIIQVSFIPVGAAEIQVSFINDSMGFGTATEWDDRRTFGLGLGLERNGFGIDLSYIALTRRNNPEPEANRVDEIHSGILFEKKTELYETGCGIFSGTGKASFGAVLAGDFRGKNIQKSWHNASGIVRAVPDRYPQQTSFSPCAEISGTGQFMLNSFKNSGYSFFGQATIGARALYPDFGIISGIGAGETGRNAGFTLEARYRTQIIPGAFPLADSVAKDESGWAIRLDTKVGFLQDSVTSFCDAGLLDYSIAVCINLGPESGSPHEAKARRSLAIGSTAGYALYTRSWRALVAENLPVHSSEIWMSVKSFVGSSSAIPVPERVGHMQAAFAALEWAHDFTLPCRFRLEPFAGAGCGIRSDWTYIHSVKKALIDQASTVPAALVYLGTRIYAPETAKQGTRYGIELSALLMAPFGSPAGGILETGYHISRPVLLPSLSLICSVP